MVWGCGRRTCDYLQKGAGYLSNWGAAQHGCCFDCTMDPVLVFLLRFATSAKTAQPLALNPKPLTGSYPIQSSSLELFSGGGEGRWCEALCSVYTRIRVILHMVWRLQLYHCITISPWIHMCYLTRFVYQPGIEAENRIALHGSRRKG